MNILLIAGLSFALLAGVYLGWQGRKIVEQQRRLEKTIEELNEIVKRRRLPYPAAAGLEDAIAIAIELIDQHQAEMALEGTRLNQLWDRLRQVRSNPQGYDVNQPDKSLKGKKE